MVVRGDPPRSTISRTPLAWPPHASATDPARDRAAARRPRGTAQTAPPVRHPADTRSPRRCVLGVRRDQPAARTGLFRSARGEPGSPLGHGTPCPVGGAPAARAREDGHARPRQHGKRHGIREPGLQHPHPAGTEPVRRRLEKKLVRVDHGQPAVVQRTDDRRSAARPGSAATGRSRPAGTPSATSARQSTSGASTPSRSRFRRTCSPPASSSPRRETMRRESTTRVGSVSSNGAAGPR